nr:M14 family metallopeptidase [uncultured Desulfobacter sp.]
MSLDFEFHGKTIPPASVEHITVNITSEAHSVIVPVTVFNGAEPGPVLGITAGVHGYEYPPILAAQKLITRINPKDLKGTVILVQIANMEGFLGRAIEINPLDGKNLNREFPGSEQGSITQRIAHFITKEISTRSDCFLDIHAGDAPQDLMPYVAYYSHTKMKEISQKGREMAMALGFDYMVTFVTDEVDYIKDGENSLFCSAEPFKQGKPSVDIECGKGGLRDEDLAEKIASGVMNMLKYLGMGKGTPKSGSTCLDITRRSWIDSKFTGIFYPKKSAGYYVSKGMELGVITDFFGRELGTVTADMDGIILYMLNTPPVRKDEGVACIGKID